ASLEVQLPEGHTTTLTLRSAQDGDYTLSLTRQLAHVTSLTLTAYDALQRPSPLTLRPDFQRGAYRYEVEVPYGAQQVQAQAVRDPALPLGELSLSHSGAPMPLALYQ